MGRRRFSLIWPILLMVVFLNVLPNPSVRAQAIDSGINNTQNAGYRIGEDPQGTGDISTAPGDSSLANSGPVRLARFSYVHGNVTWRGAESDDWSQAAINLPVRQGAQIWVTDGGRAEIQFDDGSLLRLGNGALVTLQTLHSDTDGEFTEIKLQAGLVSLRVKHSRSAFQVDTPLISASARGPAQLRLGVDEGVEIAVRSGAVTVESSQDKTILERGDYLNMLRADSRMVVEALPGRDTWDRWNDDRDRQLEDAVAGSYLPPNIALVAGNLNDYGTWRHDPAYGSVWCPRSTYSEWRPYHNGNWVWVEPFGWTWVSAEPWGWAPYHYGTWVCGSYGWAWVPGPATQYWCPAVVHFSEYNGQVAWAPLCPTEVRYPSRFNIGFRGGDWSVFFSIGQAAVYYPINNQICVARPWRTIELNRVTNVTNVYNNTTIINNRFTNRNTYLSGVRFVPQNARTAAGVTSASLSAFGGRGPYQSVPRGTTEFYTRGRGIGAPPLGARPLAGPIGGAPTNISRTPSRTFEPGIQQSRNSIARPVFRSSVPTVISRDTTPASPAHGPAAGGIYRSNSPGGVSIHRPGTPDGVGTRRHGTFNGGGVSPGSSNGPVTGTTRNDGMGRHPIRMLPDHTPITQPGNASFGTGTLRELPLDQRTPPNPFRQPRSVTTGRYNGATALAWPTHPSSNSTPSPVYQPSGHRPVFSPSSAPLSGRSSYSPGRTRGSYRSSESSGNAPTGSRGALSPRDGHRGGTEHKRPESRSSPNSDTNSRSSNGPRG